jgi:hypothetical protein
MYHGCAHRLEDALLLDLRVQVGNVCGRLVSKASLAVISAASLSSGKRSCAGSLNLT